MLARDSRSEYEHRIHKVMEHIDRHIDEPLDLPGLAAVAHFSPFHFHRLFAAWTGETLGDYLRRRRVEVAAMRLASQPRLPVLHAALSVGFGSAEAFSRAFKVRFGASPSAWRVQWTRSRGANSNPGQVLSNPGQIASRHNADDDASRSFTPEPRMNVKLIDRTSVDVAYLRHIGPYGEAVTRFWQRTVYPWLAANDLLDAPRYGNSHDDPSITDPTQCRYDACVEVPADAALGGRFQRTTLPGGRYAVLPFEGTVAEVGDAWDRLLRDWLASSGLQLDARPCFEHYPRGSKFDPPTGVFDCEICIAVAPL